VLKRGARQEPVERFGKRRALEPRSVEHDVVDGPRRELGQQLLLPSRAVEGAEGAECHAVLGQSLVPRHGARTDE